MESELNNQSEKFFEKQSIWSALWEAIKGTDADYTKIGLRKAIFLLAVPMILELVMESTFAVVDIYFVGQLGADAVAIVGLTETYLFLIYSVAMGLSTAITAIIARRIGEKQKEEAGITAVQAIVLSVLISLPFAISGIFYSTELLSLMGASEESILANQGYMQWLLGGNVVIVLIFIINGIFRGAGDAAIAMRVLWIANAINIVLDPLLIFGLGPIPGFGIEGAAMATTIGRGIGVSIQLWTLSRGGKHIKIKIEHVKRDLAIMSNIVKTSLGGIGQMLVAMTSWIFLMRILADVGSEAVAGATIAIRIMMFTLMPAWGLSNAAATLVGQNLGSGNPDRAESTVWKIGLYNMLFLIVVSVVYFIYHDFLVAIFSEDMNVIKIGGEWIRILSYSYFIYGWWMVAVQAFNGAGDTRTPTYINIVFFWLMQIPLAYYLAIELNWEQSGVFWAVFFSETSAGIFTLFMFKRGKWKENQV